MLYHRVQPGTMIGIYRTFWALLDLNGPNRILSVADDEPLLKANTGLMEGLKDLQYLSGVVFSMGIVDSGDHYIVASGAEDVACRITHIPKSVFC